MAEASIVTILPHLRFSFQVTLQAELRCVVRLGNFRAVSLPSLRLYLVTCGIRIIWSPDIDSEKAMAPHSSTLAWKIPWMEEPGRLQSMGSPRVGHD